MNRWTDKYKLLIWKHHTASFLPLRVQTETSPPCVLIPVLPDAIWEDRGQNGVRQIRGRSPASSPSPSQQRVFWSSLRTESQRGVGAVGAVDMMAQCLHVNASSKYVRAALPAAAVLRFPVAAFVDVDLLTRDAVLAALKPTGLVVVVRHAWKKRARY